jgi:hypothetical protein
VLGFFRGIAQLGPHEGGGGRRVTDGFQALVAGISWCSIVALAALGLAAPLVSILLLNASGSETVTTFIVVLSALPPAAFVAALTSPLIAQHQETGVAATYSTGVAVVAAGGCLVLLVVGPSAPAIAIVLALAEIAMAIQLAPRARALLGEARVTELLLRAVTAAGLGLVAAALPSVRAALLAALLIVAVCGLAASTRRLLRARRPSAQPAVEPGAAS